MKLKRGLKQKDAINMMLDPEGFFKGELDRVANYLVSRGYARPEDLGAGSRYVVDGELRINYQEKRVEAHIKDMGVTAKADAGQTSQAEDYLDYGDPECYDHLPMPPLPMLSNAQIKYITDNTLTIHSGDRVVAIPISRKMKDLIEGLKS